MELGKIVVALDEENVVLISSGNALQIDNRFDTLCLHQLHQSHWLQIRGGNSIALKKGPFAKNIYV